MRESITVVSALVALGSAPRGMSGQPVLLYLWDLEHGSLELPLALPLVWSLASDLSSLSSPLARSLWSGIRSSRPGRCGLISIRVDGLPSTPSKPLHDVPRTPLNYPPSTAASGVPSLHYWRPARVVQSPHRRVGGRGTSVSLLSPLARRARRGVIAGQPSFHDHSPLGPWRLVSSQGFNLGGQLRLQCECRVADLDHLTACRPRRG